jgi:hypothetical protein
VATEEGHVGAGAAAGVRGEWERARDRTAGDAPGRPLVARDRRAWPDGDGDGDGDHRRHEEIVGTNHGDLSRTIGSER